LARIISEMTVKRKKTPPKRLFEELKNALIPQPLLPNLGEGEPKLRAIPLSQYWERGLG
jgi:hypothetical protein